MKTTWLIEQRRKAGAKEPKATYRVVQLRDGYRFMPEPDTKGYKIVQVEAKTDMYMKQPEELRRMYYE